MSNFKLKLQDKAPELLSIGGIAGFVVATVLACRATWKSKDKIEECKEVCAELESDVANQVVDVETAKRCKKEIVVKTAAVTAKEFLPAAIVMTASIYCSVKSNKLHSNRTAAATAAVATLSNMFERYRRNVIADQGAEKDLEYRLGSKNEVVEREYVDENGKKKKSKETIKVIDPNDFTNDSFCKVFDASSGFYEDSAEYNISFLKAKEKELNRQLKRKGYLFLNDVLESIDLPAMAAGQFMGWLHEKDNRLNGPNSFSFNMINDYNHRTLNGYEPVVILNLKPDGNIYSLLYKTPDQEMPLLNR